MEKITLDKNIKVFYVTAKSFPEGIPEVTNKLHNLFSYKKERRIFGLSRPENNEGIVYRTAAEELCDGEGEGLGCNTLIIPKGQYVTIQINDFRKDIMSISKAFQKLLKEPNLDSQGYYLECYASEKGEVTCMIRLDE